MRTVPGRTDRVVIVGAGLAGLSAALRLRGAGREVTVVERDTGPGGLGGDSDGALSVQALLVQRSLTDDDQVGAFDRAVEVAQFE